MTCQPRIPFHSCALTIFHRWAPHPGGHCLSSSRSQDGSSARPWTERFLFMLRVSIVNPFPFLPGNVPILPGEEERLQLWNVYFFQPVKTRHYSLMLMDSCRCNLQHGCHICDIWASSSVPNLSPVQFAPVPPILPSGHPQTARSNCGIALESGCGLLAGGLHKPSPSPWHSRTVVLTEDEFSSTARPQITRVWGLKSGYHSR